VHGRMYSRQFLYVDVAKEKYYSSWPPHSCCWYNAVHFTMMLCRCRDSNAIVDHQLLTATAVNAMHRQNDNLLPCFDSGSG
jgi:hypothetical protein